MTLEGWFLLHRGSIREGLERIEHAWRTARQIDNVFAAFEAAWIRGAVAWHLCDYRDSLAWWQREIEHLGRAGAHFQRQTLMRVSAQGHAEIGNLGTARACLEEARWEGPWSSERVAMYADDLDSAEGAFVRSRDVSLRSGNRMFECVALLALCEIYRAQDDLRRAEEHAIHAAAIAGARCPRARRSPRSTP